MTSPTINIFTEAIYRMLNLVTCTGFIVCPTVWTNRNLKWKTLILVINCCNAICTIRYFQTHCQLLKLTIRDMPFETKLTTLVNMQGLTDSVSLEDDHKNDRNSRGHHCTPHPPTPTTKWWPFRRRHFSWMRSFVIWLKFHWSVFIRVQLTITLHWFR